MQVLLPLAIFIYVKRGSFVEVRVGKDGKELLHICLKNKSTFVLKEPVHVSSSIQSSALLCCQQEDLKVKKQNQDF